MENSSVEHEKDTKRKEQNRNKTKTWMAKNVQKVLDSRRNTKIKLVQYKGGKCNICGYDKPNYSVYHFHHIDPSTKDFNIGGKGITRSIEVLMKEADKCILVCANCHAEIHEKEYTKSRELTAKRYKEHLENIEKFKKKYNTECECGNKKNKKAKRCLKCYLKDKQKNKKL